MNWDTFPRIVILAGVSMSSKVGNGVGAKLEKDLGVSREAFAIQALSILEKDSNQSYLRFCSLAKSIFLIPHAYISMAPKGSENLRIRMNGKVVEVQKEGSFCGCVLERSEILVVQNAIEDERFRDSPLVRDKMQIRFYAGVPLHRESDEPFGTLCVMDTIPRTFDEGRLTILRDLSRQIVEHLEIEVRNRVLVESAMAAKEAEGPHNLLFGRTRSLSCRPNDHDSEPSLEDEIDRIFDLFSSEASAKGVELVSNIPEDLRVAFDRDALWMVLCTTIFNGIRYCVLGGSVKVEAWKSARHLLVSISDSGAGMPSERVEKVLGENPAISRLAACRRLLESNNGQMDILTEKGMGTTISLTLPA